MTVRGRPGSGEARESLGPLRDSSELVSVAELSASGWFVVVIGVCKDIDERVSGFLTRPLAGEWPYLWLDATYLKVRAAGRIVSVAAIIAIAVNIDGRREIVGLHIGPSEAEVFWSDFLRLRTYRIEHATVFGKGPRRPFFIFSFTL